MYKVHHGKYTSLAMFWCAVDMMNLLLGKAVDQSEESLSALAEAEKIYKSLQRLAPKIYDESGACHQSRREPRSGAERAEGRCAVGVRLKARG
jgi:hypothetical protein